MKSSKVAMSRRDKSSQATRKHNLQVKVKIRRRQVTCFAFRCGRFWEPIVLAEICQEQRTIQSKEKHTM